MAKKQKNKKKAEEQKQLAMKSKKEKLEHKIKVDKERQIKIQYKNATEGLSNFMLRGLDFETFKKFVWDNNENKEYAQSIIDNYEKDRETLKIPADSLEYVDNLVRDVSENRKGHNIVMYMPCFDILEIKKIEDIGGVILKSICDLNYYCLNNLGEPKSYYFKKDFVDGLLFCDILVNNDQAIFVDKTTNEVITKHTQFLEKEVIKIKKETKVITQKKKVGLSSKEIEKALEKTKRKFEKNFFDETLLNQILENVKNNLK